jgi:magnesium transporter
VWDRLVLIRIIILISFQEKPSDFFSHMERIRSQAGSVRTKKLIFLHLLLDAVMENFYVTIENEEDKVEELI